MIYQDDIDGKCRHFLSELFDQTKGDSQVQISMYDIGTSVDMDKNVAKQVAEELIGLGMVEIRTLSGGISITEAGVEEVRKFKGDEVSSDAGGPILGEGPVLKEKIHEGIEQIVADLKREAGNLGLAFDSLTELIADLKTIEIQLTSSKPKTAIIRECFRSIRDVLENTDAGKSLLQVNRLLSDG